MTAEENAEEQRKSVDGADTITLFPFLQLLCFSHLQHCSSRTATIKEQLYISSSSFLNIVLLTKVQRNLYLFNILHWLGCVVDLCSISNYKHSKTKQKIYIYIL